MKYGSPNTSALVVGAGISGLAAAWRLARAGADVTVLEAADRPGGLIRSQRDRGFLVEHGPNTVLARTAALVELIGALGLEDRLLRADAHAKRRYVMRDGQLVRLPGGPLDLLRTPLWSPAAKLGLLLEPFRGRGRDARESVSTFVRRRLGRELLEYAVEPFVAGTFAGDPDRLEARSALRKLVALETDGRSLLRGALRAARRPRPPRPALRGMITFADGLEALPAAIADALGDRLRLRVASRAVSPGWRVQTDAETLTADQLVLAVPPAAAAQLIGAWAPGLADGLRRVHMAAVAVVQLGLRASDLRVQPDGFGYLIPRRERRQVLGVLWPSNVFSGRAPAGHHLASVFIGGDRQPELAALPASALIRRAREAVASSHGLAADPVATWVRHYPAAIPQYRPGHAELEAEISALERRHPGLALIGSYREGISLPDCVANGVAAADRLMGSG